VCIQQAPDRVGQSDAVYEVVSLQREAERKDEERGRLMSPNEEEEAEEGMGVLLFLSFFFPRDACFLLSLTILIMSYIVMQKRQILNICVNQ